MWCSRYFHTQFSSLLKAEFTEWHTVRIPLQPLYFNSSLGDPDTKIVQLGHFTVIHMIIPADSREYFTANSGETSYRACFKRPLITNLRLKEWPPCFRRFRLDFRPVLHLWNGFHISRSVSNLTVHSFNSNNLTRATFLSIYPSVGPLRVRAINSNLNWWSCLFVCLFLLCRFAWSGLQNLEVRWWLTGQWNWVL